MQKTSILVLQECAELQSKKSEDYQNVNSQVKQAMHYRRGVDSIHDTMHGKMPVCYTHLTLPTTPYV